MHVKRVYAFSIFYRAPDAVLRGGPVPEFDWTRQSECSESGRPNYGFRKMLQVRERSGGRGFGVSQLRITPRAASVHQAEIADWNDRAGGGGSRVYFGGCDLDRVRAGSGENTRNR